MLKLAWGASSDVGLHRAVNEDAVLSAPPIFLVADGMGGYAAGDVASATVVDEFTAAVGCETVTAEWVTGCLARSNQRVVDGAGGGTTVAGAAVIQQGGRPYWLVFNIGDSRVYHRVGNDVQQVTVDHSVVQEMVDSGALAAERARTHPRRHIITRAVGSSDQARADLWLLPIETGERLMMCSDGVTSELDDRDIRSIVAKMSAPQETADALVRAALTAGGRDNTSAVIVDVISADAAQGDVRGNDETRPRRTAEGHVRDDADDTVPRNRPPEPVGGAL